MSSGQPASGTGRAPDIRFRGYQPGDIPECARLARDAWPAGPAMASKEIELSGMEGYMEYSLEASNWTDIAYTPNEVIGFLFGRIDRFPDKEPPKRSVLGEVPSLLRSIMDREHRNIKLLTFGLSVALTEFKLKLNTPRSDAAIEMFIVDSRFREMGIGSQLLGRFLAAAKGSGAKLVTVYTDEMMSNWRFYENRGFRRVATFHDNITSHYSGSKTRGIVLAKGLDRDD